MKGDSFITEEWGINTHKKEFSMEVEKLRHEIKKEWLNEIQSEFDIFQQDYEELKDVPISGNIFINYYRSLLDSLNELNSK